MPVDDALVVEERLVRVLERGREELDRGGVQEERPAAVEPQVPGGDEARVAGEEAIVPPAENPAVRLADEEPIVAVDRDRRGADLDGEGHALTLLRSRAGRRGIVAAGGTDLTVTGFRHASPAQRANAPDGRPAARCTGR